MRQLRRSNGPRLSRRCKLTLMRKLLPLVALLFSAGLSSPAWSAPADDYQAAYAKAEVAIRQADALKNQWTTTLSELAAAKKAADAGDFDAAVAHARQAEALANASIAQAKEQESAWTKAVIR